MRKIIVGAQVSMDGVMQAPGGSWEDPTQGFGFGGWAMPHFDAVFGEDIERLFGDAPNLVTQGSTVLVHALLASDLVDAISIFTLPIVLGRGKKLFADGSAPRGYELRSSRVSPKGLVVAHYDRAGDVKSSDTDLERSSALELARRERMKREGVAARAAACPRRAGAAARPWSSAERPISRRRREREKMALRSVF